MKNPSEAGKIDHNNRLLSDDTVYNVLDYFYKLGYCKVIILNLFAIYGGSFNKFKNYKFKDLIGPKNDKEIFGVLKNIERDRSCLVAAWGGYPKITKSKNEEDKVHKVTRKKIRDGYDKRVKDVLKIIEEIGIPLYKVGDGIVDEEFPPHGKGWYDYEPLVPYF